MNHFLRDIEEARSNGAPVVLYGFAKLGRRLLAFLNSMSVDVSVIAVDRAFAPIVPSYLGIPVVIIDELVESGNAYNYIVAFNPRNRREHIRERLLPSARLILLYDFGYGVCEDVYSATACYAGYASCYRQHIDEVFGWLEDARSRETLRAFIEQKQTGLFGIYSQFFTPHQYFPDDVIRLKDGCDFLDCGAYNGDTITAFLDKLNRDGIAGYSSIYAFEPAADAFRQLQTMSASLDNCRIMQKGVWDEECTLHFHQNGRESIFMEEGALQVETVTIDAVLEGRPASFIKMDVEGAELRALHGAAATIRNHRPALAVCIYHKPEDLLTIPRFIKKLHPDYKLYIRGHSTLATNELVLYAV